MQIVNGRWVDSNEDPISINNFEDFKKIIAPILKSNKK
jgi:hypothetical protein